MFKLNGNLKFVTLNYDYIKYLHEICAEVSFKSVGYENKPFVGILFEDSGLKYVIPFSSGKEKYKNHKDYENYKFLVYEECVYVNDSSSAIYKNSSDKCYKHILSMLDLKKMIPIKEGTYNEIDFTKKADDTDEKKRYKSLLEKEYIFCVKKIDKILLKANELYEKQKTTGKIKKFCVDFTLLENACLNFHASLT